MTNGHGFGKVRTLQKLKFFLWKISHFIFPSKQFLQNRGMDIDKSCSWCNHELEDMNHILWYCPLAVQQWSVFSLWLNIPLIRLKFQSFDLYRIAKHKAGEFDSKYWNILVAANLWTIWIARKACSFNGIRKKHEELECMMKSFAYDRISAR